VLIKDKREKWIEVENAHGGEGQGLVCPFFRGKIDPNMLFLESVLKPRAYCGYHRHDGTDEIYYIVSGKGEYVQDGERCLLGPGDATLVKSGQSHAIKNIGDEDLKVLCFCAALKDREHSEIELPLPEAVKEWKLS
jgi:mannose-6-phosphate isomerase-like protein (cupin superfamily)